MNQIFKIFKNIIENDIKLTYILFGILFLYVMYIFNMDGRLFIYNDGWYYSSIARSIIAGKGFANPFDVETGPTAWIPPLLVYVFIPIYKTIGDNFAGHFFIMFIQIIGISVGFYYLLKTWSITAFKKNNLIVFIIFIFLIFSYPLQIFRMINDLWLYILISCLEIYALTNYIKNGKSLSILILLSILIPLAAPIFAPGFIIVMLLLFLSDFGHKINFKLLRIFPKIGKPRFIQIILIGIIFGLSVSVWAIRNYRVFDKLILSKSNQWFEFYLSNVKDEDGILSESTVENYHPDRNREKFKDEIKAKNEVGWLKQYDSISHVYLKEHRADYYKKVLNRCKNTLIFTEADNNMIGTYIAINMPDSDKLKLSENFMIKDTNWVCINSNPTMIWKKISKLFPYKEHELYDNWKKCKVSYLHAKYSKRYLFTGLMMALFPLLSLIFLVVFARKIDRTFVYSISIIYFVYLIPYILISHEVRYQQPLYGLQSLLISIVFIFILNTIIDYFKQRKLREN